MEELVAIIIPLGCAVVLPITVVWLNIRKKMNEDNIRKEIVLAALEKNANVDIEDLVRKINGPKKLLKEKILNKLQTGIITIFLGIGFFGYGIFIDILGGSNPGLIRMCYLLGIVLFVAGIAFLISYRVGKKMLAGEMDAELKALEPEKA